MTTPAPILEARAVTRIIGDGEPVALVRDVSAQFQRGQFTAITGPSGSGKSSLLYLLGLLDRPTSGTVLIDGQDTAALDSDALARLRLARLGFVFQFHFLLPEFSARDNLLLPMRQLGRLSADGQQARAQDLLARFDLAAYADKRPGQLSGGQRQRVAVARALANDPDIVLADEPTGNLDTKNAALVFDSFTRLAAEDGRCVIAVTHDMDLARRADRRIHIVDGQVATVDP